MSGKAGDQDASPPTISTSEISAVKRLTSEWLAGVMRLPDGTNITSKDLLQACVNVHTTMDLPIAVAFSMDGTPAVDASSPSSLPSGSDGIFAEFLTLLGEKDVYIILPAILADNKAGALTSVKTMGTNDLGDELLSKVDVGKPACRSFGCKRSPTGSSWSRYSRSMTWAKSSLSLPLATCTASCL